MLAFLDQYLPPVLGIVLAAVGLALAAWGLLPFRRPDGGSRRDLGVALVIGLVAGAAVGTFVRAFIGGFACMDTEKTAACYTVATPVAIGVGLVIALASVVGFAVLMRWRPSSALVGAFVGPIVLVAIALGTSVGLGALSYAASAEREAQAAAVITDRSQALHLAVSEVRVTMAGPNVVGGIGLRVTIHSDREVRLDSESKNPNPRFVFTTPDGNVTEGTGAWPTTTLAAGSDTSVDLAFAPIAGSAGPSAGRIASTYGDPAPGTWHLRVDLIDDEGNLFQLETDVVISAAA